MNQYQIITILYTTITLVVYVFAFVVITDREDNPWISGAIYFVASVFWILSIPILTVQFIKERKERK